MNSAKNNLVVTYTKCSCRAIKQISNKFHKAAITIIIFLVSFAGIALKKKTWKGWPNVFKFQSISKQFLSINIVLKNKTGPLFLKFNWCEKRVSFIMKIENSVDVASLKLRAWMPRTTTSASHMLRLMILLQKKQKLRHSKSSFVFNTHHALF